MLWIFLELTELTTLVYHRESIGLVKLYNCTLVEILPHYVSGHQNDWETYVQSLPDAHSQEIQRQDHPSNVILPQKPPNAATLDRLAALAKGTCREMSYYNIWTMGSYGKMSWWRLLSHIKYYRVNDALDVTWTRVDYKIRHLKPGNTYSYIAYNKPWLHQL